MSSTAMFPRINKTQREAFAIYDMHLMYKYNKKLNSWIRDALTWYGRVTTCLWDTCFKGWCRRWFSWHFQSWKPFRSRIYIEILLKLSVFRINKYFPFAFTLDIFFTFLQSSIHHLVFAAVLKGLSGNVYRCTGIYYLKSLFEGDLYICPFRAQK